MTKCSRGAANGINQSRSSYYHTVNGSTNTDRGFTLCKTGKPLRRNDFLTCQKLTKTDSRMIECRVRPHVFHQVGHGVALGLQEGSGEGCPRGGGGVDTGGMIHEVWCEGRILNLAVLQVPGELVDDGTYHLQMAQLLCTCRGVKMAPCAQQIGDRIIHILTYLLLQPDFESFIIYLC